MEFEDFYREHRDGLWKPCYLARKNKGHGLPT
jgi:hypothetical protein